MAGGNSLSVKELLQRRDLNVVHQALQQHMRNVHIGVENVCVIQRHGLFQIRLIRRTIRVGVAFLFWAVFQEADQIDILNGAVILELVFRAWWCGAVVHAQPLQANITPMPPKMMMA